MQGAVVAITLKLTRDKVLCFELGNEEFGFVHLILDSSFVISTAKVALNFRDFN